MCNLTTSTLNLFRALADFLSLTEFAFHTFLSLFALVLTEVLSQRRSKERGREIFKYTENFNSQNEF